ncbi:hypothetical protein RF11_08328 [Thelohanellus kitauei]|uniref:Uncharacterized protein n=1 Tax=Thelohanellus kitauei TaxID=669202 RepID=A0A0C2MT47_THEKT|nr:hypothetical protein RF11_08328 [Thelohanellus kitauei]
MASLNLKLKLVERFEVLLKLNPAVGDKLWYQAMKIYPPMMLPRTNKDLTKKTWNHLSQNEFSFMKFQRSPKSRRKPKISNIKTINECSLYDEISCTVTNRLVQLLPINMRRDPSKQLIADRCPRSDGRNWKENYEDENITKKYGILEQMDYAHLTVDHAINFVDHNTGTYTQMID